MDDLYSADGVKIEEGKRFWSCLCIAPISITVDLIEESRTTNKPYIYNADSKDCWEVYIPEELYADYGKLIDEKIEYLKQLKEKYEEKENG